MACTPKLDQPQLDGNDIIFRGHCEGTCAGGECQAKFSLTLDGKTNKGAKVTASGYGGPQAFIRVTADDNIDDGLVILKCSCGEDTKETQYHFTLEHRTTIEDIFKDIVTLFIRELLKKL